MPRPSTLDRTPVPELIERKRDGHELGRAQLQGLLWRYLDGEVGDEQMAALLMAGVIRGFTPDEAVALTEVMLDSGDTVDLRGLRGPTVDKHSTGGVGDTTTLVVAPLLAACGVQVAKLSGRGLGHTGGTLDKLESIPGLRVDLDADQLHTQVERIGLAVAAATADLVPADKRLYALRDVTGTVGDPALIAASVMSKKLAGGADHVLLDVKTGDGAFMHTEAAARDLAELCVRIGVAHGRRTAALVTDMSQPLGPAIGNALEVAVAVEVLQAARTGRLAELCVELATGVLVLTGREPSAAREEVDTALQSGAGLDRFRQLVTAQGGTADVADAPREVLPAAPVVRDWAPGAGYVEIVGCQRLGEIAGALGAGRAHQGATIDLAVGLELLASAGQHIEAGQALVRIHAASEDTADTAQRALADAVRTRPEPVVVPELVRCRVGFDS